MSPGLLAVCLVAGFLLPFLAVFDPILFALLLVGLYVWVVVWYD